MVQCIDNLKGLRLATGHSQNRFARVADLDRATISAAENGRDVTDLTVVKYAKALTDLSGRDVSPVDITRK